MAPDVPSALRDLRSAPLADVTFDHPVALDEALARVLPPAGAAPVPVAAFNSAI